MAAVPCDRYLARRRSRPFVRVPANTLVPREHNRRQWSEHQPREGTDWAATRRMRRINGRVRGSFEREGVSLNRGHLCGGRGDRGGHAVPELGQSVGPGQGSPVGSGTAVTATCWERQDNPRRRSQVKGTIPQHVAASAEPGGRGLPRPCRNQIEQPDSGVVRPGRRSDRPSSSTPQGLGFVRQRGARTDDCVKYRPSGPRR